ncbi:hypothetical protein RJT34_12754 [Clitoria ternatea]|uniref:Uncharacterized protein n=1 Tax=Clitoria ternatea TaxID=43366 RepID=A0AAN9PLP5_CLITE
MPISLEHSLLWILLPSPASQASTSIATIVQISAILIVVRVMEANSYSTDVRVMLKNDKEDTTKPPGDPASEVLKDRCQNLMHMCQHVRSTFDEAVITFKRTNIAQAMDSK